MMPFVRLNLGRPVISPPMTYGQPLAAAFAALEGCESALVKLDKLCCEPGRSPSMQALSQTLSDARAGLGRVAVDEKAAGSALFHLEEAGAQIGRLQVGCCAPSRLPLYATFLESLTTAQIAINQSRGLGH